VPGAVVDLEQEPQVREIGQHLGEGRGERGVEQDRRRATVVQEVTQLVGDVAVVDVDRRAAGLGGAHHALEVLVAVVEVEGDVIVGRGPARVVRGLGVDAEPMVGEDGRQPAGPVRDIGPGEAAIPPDDALALRHGGRDRLVERRDVELLGHPVDGHAVRTYGVREARACRPSSPPSRRTG